MLKDPAARVRETDAEVLYLGHRMTRARPRRQAGTFRRFGQQVRALVRIGDVEAVKRSVASYPGVPGP